MRRTAELYMLTENGQHLAGTIKLADDELFTTKAQPGYEIFMQGVMMCYHVVGNRKIYRDQEPRAWFDSLPLHYRGAYASAVLRD